MFEFNQRSRGRVAPTILRSSDTSSGRPEITHASFLVWGEHCIECAAPSCFQTCDLYDPRPDLRCRRFDSGPILRRDLKGGRGPGVEIRFKKWARLEARGNVGLMEVRSVRWLEDGALAAAMMVSPVGRIVHKLTGDIRWSFAHQALMERMGRYLQARPTAEQMRPDYFLLEIVNPSDQPEAVQIGFTFSAEERKRNNPLVQILPAYKSRLTLPPGYSCHRIPYQELTRIVADGHAFDVDITPDGESTPTLIFLTADFVKLKERPVMSAAARSAPAVKEIKCVVWDLDNTLWRGVLAENDQLELRSDIVEVLRELDERGILLSIASKNDPSAALEALERFGIKELFLYPQIGWTPKGQAVAHVARALNIGVDSLAFIDDNPFELEEVQSMNPDVLCINIKEVESLKSDPRFQGGRSNDARHRRAMYQTTIARETAEAGINGDYFAFLKSCEIVLDVAEFQDSDLERVAELVQRTNQLNFSGTKYTRQELDVFLADASLKKFVLKCADKFGSYGTVG